MPKHNSKKESSRDYEYDSDICSDSDKDDTEYKYKEKSRCKKRCYCQNGNNGQNGHNGNNGQNGHTGPMGPMGHTGKQGTAGTVLGGADFYALMPGDNSATVAPGTAVEFPNDGPNMNTNIVRAGPSTFTLKTIGCYMIQFQVSITEAGQLALAIGGNIVPYTVVGRATGTSQITGVCLFQTTIVNSVISVINPPGNSTALTITPVAGGTHSVSAHITILQLS